MTRKRFWKFASLAALAGSVAGGAAWAQGHAGFHRFAFGRHAMAAEFLIDYLDLTPAQQEQAKAIHEQTQTANAAYVQQLKQIADQARDAVKAGKSEAELRQIANSAGPIASQVAANGLAGMSKFYAILTPEQKAKAEKLHDRMKDRFEQMHPAIH